MYIPMWQQKIVFCHCDYLLSVFFSHLWYFLSAVYCLFSKAKAKTTMIVLDMSCCKGG